MKHTYIYINQIDLVKQRRQEAIESLLFGCMLAGFATFFIITILTNI